jgi:hypothetical protein
MGCNPTSAQPQSPSDWASAVPMEHEIGRRPAARQKGRNERKAARAVEQAEKLAQIGALCVIANAMIPESNAEFHEPLLLALVFLSAGHESLHNRLSVSSDQLTCRV